MSRGRGADEGAMLRRYSVTSRRRGPPRAAAAKSTGYGGSCLCGEDRCSQAARPTSRRLGP
eukprot:8327953-Heterocapsa_arctica.AAC.1